MPSQCVSSQQHRLCNIELTYSATYMCVLTETTGRPSLCNLRPLAATLNSFVLPHTCVCSLQSLVGQTFVNLDPQCNSALICLQQHLVGRTLVICSTPGCSPDLIYFAAHMCMVAAAIGRASLVTPDPWVQPSSDSVCNTHVYVHSSRWSAKA